ncbi:MULTISPECIES: acyltransferase [unclassified Colwellia]|uniref:acyltransferase n=2 Tax=Colwellia TaxID=28228 RepID=UPI001C7152A9|nr:MULTISPECIES: acyltransferase [unclassified Colwellia]
MGRFIFKYFNFILLILAKVLSVLPSSLLNTLFSIASSMPTLIGVGIRYVLLKSISPKIGDNVYIARWVVIKSPSKLEIGNNVSIHEFSYIDAKGGISIGDDTSLAHNCSLISFEHSWGEIDKPIKYNKLLLSPIHIAQDVWVGCGARILSGVSIPSRSIIAAGSVVTSKSVEKSPGIIYAGVPAKKIKKIC